MVRTYLSIQYAPHKVSGTEFDINFVTLKWAHPIPNLRKMLELARKKDTVTLVSLGGFFQFQSLEVQINTLHFTVINNGR